MTRQMVMVGFLQAQNCTNLPCSWRHPESRDDAHSAAYYQEMRPGLFACQEAQNGLRRLFYPDVPAQFRPLKLAAPGVASLVVATLPRWARRMYGLPGLPTTDLAATMTLTGTSVRS